MATNKNAQLRYQILDRCFSNYQKRYEIDDLLNEVNEQLHDIFDTTVSMRQIREDIKYMRDRVSFNAPIVAYNYDGKKCYYRYSDRNFSIYNNELSVADLNKLQSTIDMLGRFRGTATNVWLEEVISNLEYRFGLKSNAEHLVSFEQNEQLKGIEHLADIIDATINHQTLEIVYLTYKGKVIPMTIYPYYIKQYNGRWFLYGHNDQLNRISNLALDRIERAGCLKHAYPTVRIFTGHIIVGVIARNHHKGTQNNFCETGIGNLAYHYITGGVFGFAFNCAYKYILITELIHLCLHLVVGYVGCM